MVINNYKIRTMKHLNFILIFLFAFSLQAQVEDVIVTDSIVIIKTQGREYSQTVIDSVGVDSAYQLATLAAVSDWESTKSAGERMKAAGAAKVKTANKAIKELQRKALKAKKKGAAKVKIIKLEADEVGQPTTTSIGVKSDFESEKELSKLSTSRLKKMAANRGLTFDRKAKKAELVKLLWNE